MDSPRLDLTTHSDELRELEREYTRYIDLLAEHDTGSPAARVILAEMRRVRDRWKRLAYGKPSH